MENLPPAPRSDASVEIVEMVHSFSRDLSDMIFGLSEDKSMVQNNISTYRTFKRDIWATAPNFVPSEVKDFGANVMETDKGNSQNDDNTESVLEPLYLRDIRRIIKRFWCNLSYISHNK